MTKPTVLCNSHESMNELCERTPPRNHPCRLSVLELVRTSVPYRPADWLIGCQARTVGLERCSSGREASVNRYRQSQQIPVSDQHFMCNQGFHLFPISRFWLSKLIDKIYKIYRNLRTSLWFQTFPSGVCIHIPKKNFFRKLYMLYILYIFEIRIICSIFKEKSHKTCLVYGGWYF